MNTNSNTYTVIYSTILVVVVAAVLAFAATALKGKQEENVKVDTISQILTAAGLEYNEGDVLQVYKENIKEAILVNAEGQEVGTLNTETIESLQVYGNSELKAQMAADQKSLPVYIFNNGVTVVPCYGAGLWGPIWGYIGFEGDLKTIKAVCFGHKGEILFEVVKPANRQTENNGVDAISGATITSQALGKTLNQWFGFYQNYLAKNGVTVNTVEE